MDAKTEHDYERQCGEECKPAEPVLKQCSYCGKVRLKEDLEYDSESGDWYCDKDCREAHIYESERR